MRCRRRILALTLLASLVAAACADSDEISDPFTDPTVDAVVDGEDPTSTTASGTAATTSTTTTTAVEEPPGTTAAPSTTTTSSTPPPATDRPTLLLTDGTTVALLAADGSTEPLLLLETPARIAHAVDETFVVVEEVEASEDRRIVIHAPDAVIDLELGPNPRLHDVQVIDGTFQVLANADVGGGLDDRSADLVLVDGTGARTFLRTAVDIEFFTVQASVAPVAGLASIAAFADLTELVEVFPIDDATVPLPGSPTEGLAYNAPPLIIYADLSEDGATLAHVEGPDFDGVSDTEVDAPWTVVVTEVGTGTELFRADVVPAGSEDQVTWVDYDGRWLVVSVGRFAPDDGAEDVELSPRPALVFDVTDPTAAPLTLPVTGTATLLATG